MTESIDGIAPIAVDYLNVDSLFTADELELRDQVRAFVDARIRPNINAWYEAARFPRELPRELGELGVLGMHLPGDVGARGGRLEPDAGSDPSRMQTVALGQGRLAAILKSAPRER